jgi:hypothetical protein
MTLISLMRNRGGALMSAMVVIFGLTLFAGVPEAYANDDDDGATGQMPTTATPRRGGRMEFDARLIRGETAGAGAVFLFQRTPRALPSMIQRRSSYLGETVHSVLGPQWEQTFEESRGKTDE